MDGSNTGDHSTTITRALEFADTIIDVLLNSKGITRLVPNESDAEEILQSAKRSADATTSSTT